jgi:hypothetical protein
MRHHFKAATSHDRASMFCHADHVEGRGFGKSRAVTGSMNVVYAPVILLINRFEAVWRFYDAQDRWFTSVFGPP